ncbi:hypothetical protein D3C74_413140 [compost metagenome]
MPAGRRRRTPGAAVATPSWYRSIWTSVGCGDGVAPAVTSTTTGAIAAPSTASRHLFVAKLTLGILGRAGRASFRWGR